MTAVAVRGPQIPQQQVAQQQLRGIQGQQALTPTPTLLAQRNERQASSTVTTVPSTAQNAFFVQQGIKTVDPVDVQISALRSQPEAVVIATLAGKDLSTLQALLTKVEEKVSSRPSRNQDAESTGGADDPDAMSSSRTGTFRKQGVSRGPRMPVARLAQIIKESIKVKG